jgi:alpha-D-ribose 1-methylphosphonate 5-triphosphate synthase subunit PhnL
MILAVRALAKEFHIHHLQRTIQVFDELSFDLHAGQFLLVSGANGTGKSSLLRCLYRSYRPTAGSAVYRSLHGPVDLARAADIDIALLRRQEIGFVTQFLHLRPRVSAVELVAEPLLSRGTAVDEALREATAWLHSLALKPEVWQAYPATFSGGEQQKVNLARALIAPRRLLLLDEPTASLDAGARLALVERLTQLKASGVAMIGVFHHPEDVARLIDGEIVLGSRMAVDESLWLEDMYVAE